MTAMNSLITENLMSLDIDLPSKAAVIDEVARLLDGDGRLVDRNQYIRDVYVREEMVPTGIGNLIAIPHARSSAVGISSLVYLRLNTKIQWSEEEDARYIFGIAVPEENIDNLHLKILSMVAKKLLDDRIRKTIEESPSKQEILEVLLA